MLPFHPLLLEPCFLLSGGIHIATNAIMMQGFRFPLRSARGGACLGGLCATASHSTTFYDLFKTAAQLPPRFLLLPPDWRSVTMAASVSAPDVSAIRGQLVHSLKTTGTLDSLKSQVRSFPA